MTPSFGTALLVWLRLGCISFGGPIAQIDLMHREVVERRAWVDERSFLHALRLCTALPGPEAQQLACYLGWRLHGIRGALASGGLFILPSLLLIIALSWIYMAFGETDVVTGIVRALGGAVVALVVAAGLRMGRKVVRTRWTLAIAAIAGLGLLAGALFPLLVVLGALAGWLIGRARPGALVPLEDEADPGVPPAVDRARLIRHALIGIGIWLAAIAALLLVGGVIAELAGFFTIVALVTFGGAYAILPFVAAAAVGRFGWLTPEQMIAGLALGETTPGPLIMVNSFVGFVAGWTTLGGGVGGVTGALVATFATFAPSFLMIAVGSPLIAHVPQRGPVADALAALQGVVAGAIAVLVIYLADHALLRDGGLDLLAAAIAVGVFLLQRRGLPVPALVVAAAGIGALVGVVDPGFGLLA
ncbi:MAG: chromate efflux transporter [Gaiellales bacterium]